MSSASADSGAIDTSSLIAGVEAARSNLQSAKENLANTPATIITGGEDNPEYAAAQDAVTVAQAALDALTPTDAEGNPTAGYADAEAALQSAQSNLEATPASLPETEIANPAVADIQARVSSLQSELASKEAELASAQEAKAAAGDNSANPELTAAYSMKAEYEAILNEIGTTFVNEKAVLDNQINAGGSSQQVDIQGVENNIQAQIDEVDQSIS